jgi:sugar lactone lactonase YvrE
MVGLVCMMLVSMLTGCLESTSSNAPKIGVLLPEKYNTPDGMVLGADGFIYLNVPNFNDANHPPCVVKISPDNKLTEVVTLPLHPETGKVGPLGIDIGPDGNLYIADNQGMCGFNDYKSRLLRVNMKDGQATGVDVVVTGILQANAVSCHGDSVYITETSLDVEASPMPSGVYRFPLSELTGAPIQLKPNAQDEHLLLKFTTDSEDWRVGANGLGFDKDGNLYVCNFGEASLLRYKLDANGKAGSPEVVAKGQGMKSTDGLKVCPKTGDIYIADFVGNAVHAVCPETGKVTTIWQNGNNLGGDNGVLDKPSEVCFRGTQLYIANIDLPYDNNEHDKPHTISVIDLK